MFVLFISCCSCLVYLLCLCLIYCYSCLYCLLFMFVCYSCFFLFTILLNKVSSLSIKCKILIPSLKANLSNFSFSLSSSIYVCFCFFGLFMFVCFFLIHVFFYSCLFVFYLFQIQCISTNNWSIAFNSRINQKIK